VGLDCDGDPIVDHLDELVKYRGQQMIDSLLDACQFILTNHGEPQSSYWLTSQIMEMKLWRASEADVRDALNKDFAKHGDSSRFVSLPDDEFALRSWTAV
jgi:DNA-directed RNA polymerase delta subunit